MQLALATPGPFPFSLGRVYSNRESNSYPEVFNLSLVCAVPDAQAAGTGASQGVCLVDALAELPLIYTRASGRKSGPV